MSRLRVVWMPNLPRSVASVAVGDLFQQVRLIVERLAANLNVHAEIRAHVKRRVNIDELQTACVLNLPPQRTRLERSENQLVVAPNQLVRPALDMAARQVEEVGLFEGFQGRARHSVRAVVCLANPGAQRTDAPQLGFPKAPPRLVAIPEADAKRSLIDAP